MQISALPVKWPLCQHSNLPCSTKQHVDELETLLTIQQAITSRLELSDVLQMIADEAQRLTSAQLSLLYVLEGDTLQVAAVSGQPNSQSLIGYRIPVSQSMAGMSIQTSQPIMKTDIRNEESPSAGEDIEYFGNIHCYMTVPLISAARPIGVIAVADQDTAVLSEDSLRVLSMLAPSAVIGLENARLYQEQQERRLHAEELHQMGESLRVMLAILNSDRSLDEILDYIVTHISHRLLDCQGMAIYALQPKQKHLIIQAAHGLPANAAACAHILPGYETARQAILTRQPVSITLAAASGEDVEALDCTPEEAEAASQVRMLYQSWLAVPLMVKGETSGAILMYYRKPRTFSEEEISLSLTFGDQVALAIENARLRIQAEQAAVVGERNRLARELHDAVSQTLFSTSLIAEVLPRLWDRDQAEGRQRLEELRQLTRGALAEMRTLLFELRPAAFNEAKLGDLLKHLTQAISSRTRVPISLAVAGERGLPPDVQVALYRITQEALNNIDKYANPKRVSVDLCLRAERVELDIKDDGCGFDPDSVSPDHLGLKIMRERSAAINAQLELISRPGCGTHISLVWTDPAAKV